jgi:Phytanoyl-CoA dioxygenase (PhyH)
MAVQRYVDSLDPQPGNPELLRLQLLHWAAFGYLVLPGAIEPALIDALLADLDELLANYQLYVVRIDCDILHGGPINELPAEPVALTRQGKGKVHLRVLDFYCYSIAAKKISLHPKIAEVLGHIFRDSPVVLQSLNFSTGSEQHVHQDFAFVPAQVPSQLAASWVALEDVHPDAGPLVYIPGSQHIRKFDWGDGMFRTEQSSRTPEDFSEHIWSECARAGLRPQTFCPKRGDVFLWHSALAHGGAAVRDPARTRLSYVTHYSQASTHLFHHMNRQEKADRVEYPGGYFHRSPYDPEGWDVFRHGEYL